MGDAGPVGLAGRWLAAMLERVRSEDVTELAGSVRLALADHAICVAAARHASGETLAESLAVRAHERDLDDAHWPSRSHPGGVVWPAILATGGTIHDPVRAAIVGYQVMADIGALSWRAVSGLRHATAFAGPAAAAAAALVARGREDRLVDGVSHALSVAGGVARSLAERRGTATFHRTHAVRTGLAAVEEAIAGRDATVAVVEGPGGLADLVGVSDPEAALAGWDGWAVADLWFRSIGTSGFNHAAAEAAAALGPVDPSAVEEAVVRVSPLVLAMHLTLEPRWDLAHAVRVGLLTGDEGRLDTGPLPAADLPIRLEPVEGAPVLGAEVVVVTTHGRRAAVREVPIGLGPRRLALAGLRVKAARFAPHVDLEDLLGRVDEALDGDSRPLVARLSESTEPA